MPGPAAPPPAAPPAPAPPAAPAPKITPPASVGSVMPPSTGTINVSSMPTGDPTVKPPKPGTAKAKLYEELQKKAGMKPDPAPQPPSGSNTPEASPPPEDGGPQQPPSSPDDDTPPATPPETPTQPEGKGGKRESPWKLVDQFKERATKAEARALELEKQVVPEEQRKASETKLTTLEKENTELRNELRYHNAEKYDPDILNLNKQYESGWKRAIGELSEITVKDPTSGQQRPATSDDLLILVNTPLGQARAIADELFGPFADDVMAHRKEIRGLFEQKRAKLEELKANAGDRETERQNAWKKSQDEMNGKVKTHWERSVTESLADEKHGAYFKPKEGNDDWNTRLEKGFKLVDDAFGMNALDPRLSDEQRAQIIKRHVAVRNRAAAFGAVRNAYEQALAKIEELTKELGQFKSSAPPAGGRTAAPAAPSQGTAREQMFSALGKIAKPQ